MPTPRETRRKLARFAKKHGIKATIKKFGIPVNADAVLEQARKNVIEQMKAEA